MKIALFSDIHANLPALESVLKDIEKQKPDFIYCLGDLVGYNVWPNEVVEQIRSKSIPTIAGNYDEGIGFKSDDCGCAYRTDEEKANGAVSISFTNEIVSDSTRCYLHMLPRHMSLEFLNEKEKSRLLMVHGSPRKINEYLFEDRTDKSLLRIMNDSNSNIMLFGHTHKPYYRKIQYEIDGRNAFCHAINIGSVGKPKDGNPRACYVVMELDEPFSKFDEKSLSIDFRRVEYDVEKAAKAVQDSPLPDAYAEALILAK